MQRTPELLKGESFRQFGAIFTSKKTLMAVCSDPTASERKTDAGFVLNTAGKL